MPVKIDLFPEKSRALFKVSGNATGEEFISETLKVYSSASFDPAFDQIVDFSDATLFSASVEEIRKIAETDRNTLSDVRVALVNALVLHAADLLYEVYLDAMHCRISVQRFETIEGAIDWLEESPSK